MPRPRVVISGLGLMTAHGSGVDALWSAMLEGRSGVRRLERFDPAPFECQVGAEVPGDFKVRSIVPKSYRKATKVMCRDIELAVGAAAAAVEDAGLVTQAVDPDAAPSIEPGRMGCHIGAGLIAADIDELTAALVTSRQPDGSFSLNDWGNHGMTNLTPLWLLKYLPNMLACHVTIVHDCRGPSNTITCCEASSMLSLAESLRVIRRGAADACLTGGAESKINLLAYYRQSCGGRLADAGEGVDPASAVRPFDAGATGTVLGEGGGLLVLESLESVKARGGRARAELLGVGSTQSPDVDMLSASPQSLGDAVHQALNSADVTADQIDAVVPFGSGIPQIDAVEAQVLRDVFGDRAAQLPLVTTVPYAGNCCAGNGAVGLAVATRCLEEQMLPARLNSAGCDGIDAAACAARPAELRHVLVMGPSQGGQNTAAVLGGVA